VDAGELLAILREWLVRHIQGVDKRYGAQFASIRNPGGGE
jgi:hemerythrin